MDEAAGRWSVREALTFAGQCWSFAHLQTAVDRMARAVLHLGMQPGDRVALWMPNRPEWLYTFFALANIGAVIDTAGWLHTGDVVTMREDGTIRFLGRYKDRFKVGGENVDPIDVEGLLLRHPAIDHVQIIGVPDPRLSEVPCACVIPKPGAEVTQEALVVFCQGQLASLKIPHYPVILDAFPMMSSGKVQQCKLRERAAAQVGAAGAGATATNARQS